MRTISLFEEERLTLLNSIELSAESLRHYGSFYKHWAIAFSGGKDSAATVTLVAHLLETGRVPLPESLTILYADTLAPIVHWRVCHVWDWLLQADLELGFPTFEIARIYGQNVSEGEEPLNARTGCMGCPLVQQDAALDRLVAQPEWAYLAPLQKLRPLYWEIKRPQYRHRKHGEVNKDGSLAAKQNRLGPLTLSARRWMLEQVLSIEAAVNEAAQSLAQPQLSLINAEELARIEELIAAKTYPEKWDGTEHRGDEWLPEILPDGSVQNLLFDSFR